MRLLPADLAGKIQFYESRLALWAANAVQIGSSALEITALTTKVSSARAALTAQEIAQNAAKTKTAALRDAVDLMEIAGSDVIMKIRSKAATDGNTVYQLADIPAPAIPTPVGKPGTPTDFKATLKPDGSVETSWKCPNPANSSGTIYHVYRRVNASDEFAFVGGSGEKKWEDRSLPAGVPSVTYSIQAVRSTAAGDAAQFIVNFGVTASGATTTTVTPTTPKIAA